MAKNDFNGSLARIALHIGSFLSESVSHFWRGLSSTLLFQIFILVAFAAFRYVVTDTPDANINFFLSFGVKGFLMFALNVALIYAFTLTLLRGLISPLIFMVTTVLYAALIKYLTGSLLLGMDIQEFIMILPLGIYTFIMAYFDGMLRGELQTAITYRTTDDD